MTARKTIVIDARNRRSSTGRYTDRLLEHLQNLDTFHSYIILVQPDDNWQPRGTNFRTAPCPYAQFSFSPLQQIGFAWQLYRIKPDLVHFTMTQQPLLYFGAIVTTTHDLTMFRFVRRGRTPKALFWVKMKLYRLLLVWSHWKSDKIIVPTNYVAADLADYQPSTKNKIVVTYEDSEPPLRAKAQRPQQVGPHDQFILYVGNAFPHKNLLKLVEAFDILHAKRPELKLILTGKKEIHYQELGQQVLQHPSAQNIIITGFVSDQELKWLYEHAQAYAFPSLSEGFGLPAMEAMQHGTPIVSSNATCLPEVCGDAAHYFNAHNPRDIAAKVAEVLDDKKLRQQLIKNGHVQVNKFSWERMAEQTLTVYKSQLEVET